MKELAIGISNKKGSEKAIVQCDQVLKHLKATNGHATRSILKNHQSLIDGPSIPILKTPCFSWCKLITPTSYTSPFLDLTPSKNDGEKSNKLQS